jgi:hypothetical protein
MNSIFYIHFNEAELKQRLQQLAGTGLQLSGHWSTEEPAKFADGLPDIFVVSLDRLPSHGSQYVQWIWEAKKRRHIPVIFVDGKPDKVDATKVKFPQAVYCSSHELPATIKRILPKPI